MKLTYTKSFTLFALFVLLGLIVLRIFPHITSAQAPDSKSGKSAITKKQQSDPRHCRTCPGPTIRRIYAPAIELNEASRAEIVLNSRSPNPIEITPTFYTTDGEAVVGRTLQLQSAEIRFVSIQNLITAAHRGRHRWGGIALSYTGGVLEVWAQITFHDVEGKGSIDETFNILEEHGSDTLEAVWLAPEKSDATIALGNSSESPIHTTVEFSGGETKVIDIAPFATKFVRRRANKSMGERTSVESVELHTTGPEGSLRVAGFITSDDGNFNSSIRFYDPQRTSQPNLFATNLRLKNTKPKLVLKNTSYTEITAHPRFFPANGEQGNLVELPAITLAPQELVQVNLRSLTEAAASRTDLDSVSVQVLNSGAAGSLIGALYSIDKTSQILYDVPLRDSGKMRNSTGSYPWRVDDDYTTIVNITNISDQPASFIVDIRYPGGHYFLPAQELAARGTATFDLRKIISEQKPDNKGEVIPASVKGGQFHWSVFGGAASSKLIGRSEVVSLSKRVSSSYSCPSCCPDSGPFGGFSGPEWAPYNGYAFVNTHAEMMDCNGFSTPMGDMSMDSMWMDDPSIASVSGMQVHGLSAGETNINGSWLYYFWYPGPEDCYRGNDYGSDSTSMQVIRLDIKQNGNVITGTTQDVIVGQKISLTADIQPAGTTFSNPQWTVPGNRIAGYTANNTTGTVTQLSNTSGSSINFYWVDGGNGRQVQLSATINGQTVTASATFNVKRPTGQVTTQTGTVNVDNLALKLRYGTFIDNGINGIAFSSNITIPSGFSGSLKWVQIATPLRRRRLNSGAWERWTGAGLDTQFPYDTGSTTNDSPETALESIYQEKTVNDSFEMWLMFLPDGTDSILVPLRKVNWSWAGDAVRSGQSWSLVSSSNTQNPSDADTTTYPTWTRNVTSNTWVSE